MVDLKNPDFDRFPNVRKALDAAVIVDLEPGDAVYYPSMWWHQVEAFAPFNGGEISPGPSVQSDQEIMDWVARDAETALHPSGTAKMGVDEMAVVDPSTMRVRGTEGLRVVDASVLPVITNGNIYAPTMMVAERASDVILGNTLLPPDEALVYLPEDVER